MWSCGIVLYVLNAGYLPFNDPNLMAMYKKIYKGEYRCPKWFSPELKRFLSRFLVTDPEKRITVDEILRDPWFKKGYKEVNYYEEVEKEEEEPKAKDMNAFDLISFSSGLDLSGLFADSDNSVSDGDRLLLTESPEKVVEEVEEYAKADDNDLKVRKKKEWSVELEGEKGNLVIGVEVYRLTDGLVVVEAKRRIGEAESFKDMWNNKLRPRLVGGLTAQPAGTSSQVPQSAN